MAHALFVKTSTLYLAPTKNSALWLNVQKERLFKRMVHANHALEALLRRVPNASPEKWEIKENDYELGVLNG